MKLLCVILCLSLSSETFAGNNETGTVSDWLTGEPDDELNLFHNGKKSYYVEGTVTANYFEAFQSCEYNRMQLVTILSKKENDFLEKLVGKLGMGDYAFWTSATILPGDHWVWFSTGKPVTYTNWNQGEPSGPSDREKCVEVTKFDSGFKWNDLDCSSNRYFICEIALPQDCPVIIASLNETIGIPQIDIRFQPPSE